ncbi:MAG: hypothetical protein KAS62_05265 [Candidatus Delongbacteria bacterium]|nr:hypothetical protein [Candidatus Delongbacteria bacterium]
MKKILVFLIVISFTLTAFAVDGTGEGKKSGHEKPKDHVCYKSIVMQINAFAKQEKYDDALKLLNKAKVNPNYTGHYEHIFKNLAFFNDKAKKYEDNIKTWNEGLDKGVTFDMDLKSGDYKPYLKLKGFDEVVKKNAEFIKKGVKAKAECDDHKEEKEAEVK